MQRHMTGDGMEAISDCSELVGGIQKGHPTEDEIAEAVEFYKNL